MAITPLAIVAPFDGCHLRQFDIFTAPPLRLSAIIYDYACRFASFYLY